MMMIGVPADAGTKKRGTMKLETTERPPVVSPQQLFTELVVEEQKRQLEKFGTQYQRVKLAFSNPNVYS